MTFTRAIYAPAGFEEDVPYVLGLADFGDGIKLFGKMDKSLSDDTIKMGMKVKVRIVDLDGDRTSHVLAVEFSYTGPRCVFSPRRA